MRRTLYCGPFVLAAMTLLVALTMPLRLSNAAGNLYWDGTGTSWITASSWSTSSSATTPDPAAKASSTDNAHFNITTVNTAQTVNLNGAQSALGLIFNSAGPVVVQSGSGTNTLTLGESGISVFAGAGAVTISTAVNRGVAGFSGSWTNNSSNLLTVSGTVSNLQGLNFQVGGTGNTTLSGSVNTANTVLTKIDSGTLTLSGTTDNNSLPVTVNGGTVVLAKTSSGSPNEVHAIGQDALTISGGTAQLGGTGGDQIYDLGTVIVTSGAFDTNARNETFSTLNLQGTGIGGAGALVNTAAGASTITPTNGTTLTADTTIGVTQSSGSLTLNNAVSGTFAITKSGLGTLVLNGTNNFTGGVTVTAGTLVGGSSQALGTGPLTINGGAVDLGAFAPSVSVDLMAGSLSFTGNLTVGVGGLLGSFPTLAANQTVNNIGTTTINPASNLTINGGTLNTTALVNNGTFNFNYGTLGITGPAGLTIGSGSPLGTTVSLAAPANLHVTNTLHINSAGRLTNVGGNVLAGNVQLDAGGRWTVSDGVQSVGTGLVNHGTLVLIDTTINGPVNSPAGSVVNVIGGVLFNQLVSGAGQFFGSGTTTFNGGYHPGDSPATVNFQGGVALGGSNTLAIELGGLTPGGQYDQVQVAGQLLLGGTLAVSFINGFTPVSTNSFDILDWGALSGTFSTIVLPTLAGGLAWNTSQLYTAGILSIDSVGLAGDYNHNGVVDAADYVMWRNNQGTNNVLPNDPIGGTIGTAQYNQWRAHFGQSAGSGSISSNTAIPEPATLNMLFAAVLALCSRRRSAT
jgi:fibronectin-binding autotransporter adhesin